MSGSVEELKLILNGVRMVRCQWLRAARRKAKEISSYSPKLTRAQAFNNALMHPEVHREYEKMINLYGVIGYNLDAYLTALGAFSEEAVPLDKRVA